MPIARSHSTSERPVGHNRGAGEAISHNGATTSSVRQWLVFSDLHVSRSSVDTCIDVLEFVNAEAQRRNAGVLFLGDFWHARGNLPVEPLNRILTLFATRWTNPTIMIPGNHDQVNLEGSVHSLEPIARASESVTIISEPQVHLGALWLPYRRRKEAILDAIERHGRDVSAIFCHVDVVGAKFNDEYQSADGLDPAAFPPSVPVYSGHYHAKQSIDNIKYIGSQYQTNFSEQNQQKSIQVLDSSEGWGVVEEIPVDIGPRHFTFDAMAADGLDEVFGEVLRAGDRVRVRNCSEEEMDAFAPILRDMGVSADLQPRVVREKVRIDEGEVMEPLALFRLYAEKANLDPKALQVGLEILSQEVSCATRDLKSTQISFEHVEISGFGPFKDPVSYRITGADVPRIRVISGENLDDLGSTSNGSGKSSLVMAPIWAFTGRTELKGEHSWRKRSLRNADIVNDASREARVTLRGQINGQEFVLERVVTRSSLKKLSFVYAGEDWTQQEARMTQDKINNLVDTRLLARIVCHDNDHVTALLTATDKQLKDELSAIVDLEFWDGAKSAASGRLKAAKEAMNAAASQEEVASRVLIHTRAHLAACEAQMDAWKGQRAAKIEDLRENLRQRESDLLEASERVTEKALLARAVVLSHAESSSLDSGGGGEAEARAKSQESLVSGLEIDLQNLMTERIEMEKRLSVAHADVDQLEDKVESFLNLQADALCPTCNQRIDSDSHETHLAEVKHALETKRDEACQIQGRKDEGVSVFLEARDALQKERAVLSTLQTEAAREAAASASAEEQRQKMVDRLSAFVSSQGARLGDAGEAGAQATLEVDIGSLHLSAERSLRDLEDCERSVEDLRSQIQDLIQENPHETAAAAAAERVEEESTALAEAKRAVTESTAVADTLKAVESAFGATGLQSFVIESALRQLEQLTASHLSELTENAIRLHLNAFHKKTNGGRKNLETINKEVYSRNSKGKMVSRTLSQLSGGERRRLAIALALGFSSLASKRCGLHCDLLVLDEVMQHLDEEGCKRMVGIISQREACTVLVVAQPHTIAYDLVDAKDIIKKERDTASVRRLY